MAGPRGAGKTPLLDSLGKGARTVWIDGNDREGSAKLLDLPGDGDPAALLKGKERLIIDEAQRIPGIGLTLKRLARANSGLENPVRVIAAASSLIGLFPDGGEPEPGLLEEFRLWPLSVNEIAAGSSCGAALQDIGTSLVFGTLPRAASDPESVRKILKEHCLGHLLRDVFEHSGIRFSPKFERLVGLLARSVGFVVTCDGLARETGLARNTVIGHLRVLEQCFIISSCGSFAERRPNEMRKGKKAYFCDNGVRSAILGEFSPLSARSDAEALWENFFFTERLKLHSARRDQTDIRFWRTTGNCLREVSFVETSPGGRMRAFQCTLSPRSTSRDDKAFAAAYPDCPLEAASPRDLMRLWTKTP